jgi:hypothetical protein
MVTLVLLKDIKNWELAMNCLLEECKVNRQLGFCFCVSVELLCSLGFVSWGGMQLHCAVYSSSHI